MREPYAKGGERDVRRRAINGVADLEWVCVLVDRQLKTYSRVGPLALCYYKKRDLYEWRRAKGKRWSTSLTEAERKAIKITCQERTRRKLDQVEELLAVRNSVKAVLRLVEWALTYGEAWQEQTVTLRWAYGEYRRAMWGCLLSGGRMQRGRVSVEDGRGSGQLGTVERLTVTKRPLVWRGEVAKAVEYEVARLERIEGKLQDHQQQMRNFIRLYYDWRLDSWQLRQIIGAGKSRYLTEQTALEVLEKLRSLERDLVGQAVQLIADRKRVKRLLHVVVALAEAAGCWPGGRWQLRGQGREGPTWVVTTMRRGLAAIAADAATGHVLKADVREIEEDEKMGNCLESDTGEDCETGKSIS